MTEITDLDRPIYGAEAIGREIGLSKTRTFYALEKKLLPASKLGKIWFTTPRRLRAFLNGEAA
jgi:hypothetical protein